jgi:hypothetical protein
LADFGRRKIHRSARISPQNRPIAGLSPVAIRHALISAAGVAIYQSEGIVTVAWFRGRSTW